MMLLLYFMCISLGTHIHAYLLSVYAEMAFFHIAYAYLHLK